jgi:FkbM family methyltransferase
MISINRLYNLLKGSQKYPISIELLCPKGRLIFEAFSQIENFRIAQYGGEKDFVGRFTKSLNADDIVFDIGASVGLITLHAAAFTHKGKVFAFEPDPETFQRLKHNVSLNNFSNIKLFPWAISDKDGKATLFSNGATGFAPSLREKGDHRGSPKGFAFRKREEVITRTLDSSILSGNLPLPTVLKIDIEGAEMQCLTGASKLLDGEFGNKPRLLYVEVHPEFLPDFHSSPKEVQDFLISNGYSVLLKHQRNDQSHYCYQYLKDVNSHEI